MALARQYETFRTTANPDCLASNAELHYVTTCVTHKDPAAIVKHLQQQAKDLKKKTEVVLSTTEGSQQLFQEVETTLEFVAGGGSYLPGLDDNLVVDQEATVPIGHVVRFDGNGKIEQIRLYWDQATVLKSVGVIGSRGNNWPIADGTHQSKLVRASTAGGRDNSLEATTQQMAETTIANRATKKVNPTNDPHTSLDLATLGERNEEQVTPQKPIVAPRGTLKPQERPWGELFVGGGASTEATPVASNDDKAQAAGSVAPKVGAGKNYGANRIFGDDTEDVDSPTKTYIKPNAKKFQHFDLADGHDEPAPPPTEPRPRTKHQSQWDFEDFTTPAKPNRTRQQSQGAHHFSFEDDTKNDSPMKQQVHKPRRDAESHIELQDDGGDPDNTSPRPSRSTAGHHHNRNESSLWSSQTDDGGPDEAGSRSYNQSTVVSQKDRHKTFDPHFQMTDDAIVGDNEDTAEKSSRFLGVGANVKDRHKDFDAHWAIDDDAPGATDDTHDASRNQPGLSQNKAKVLQTLAPQWEARDDSPSAPQSRLFGGGNPGDKENQPGIRTAGNGMGGRKGTGRQWGFGDDDVGDTPSTDQIHTTKGARRPPGGQRNVAFWEDLEDN